MRGFTLRTSLVAVAAILCSATAPALAQDRGTRTLTYDPTRRELVETPPPPAGTAEGDLFVIQTLIKDRDYSAALKGVRQFEKRFTRDHPLWPAAMIARAEALVGDRDYDKAHKVLQEFLNRYAGIELTGDALRLEVVIAETYLTGVKRKFLGLRILSGEDAAFEILDDVSVGYPNEPIAPLAIRTKADYLFRTGEHALAELEYARLVREYPNHRYHQPALKRSAEAALASFRGIEYDEAALVEAGERFSDYRTRYPSAADREGVGLVQQNIRAYRAEKEFAIAGYYERTRHLSSAIYYYESAVRSWPDTTGAAKARRRLELLGVTPAEEAVAAPAPPPAAGIAPQPLEERTP